MLSVRTVPLSSQMIVTAIPGVFPPNMLQPFQVPGCNQKTNQRVDGNLNLGDVLK